MTCDSVSVFSLTRHFSSNVTFIMEVVFVSSCSRTSKSRDTAALIIIHHHVRLYETPSQQPLHLDLKWKSGDKEHQGLKHFQLFPLPSPLFPSLPFPSLHLPRTFRSSCSHTIAFLWKTIVGNQLSLSIGAPLNPHTVLSFPLMSKQNHQDSSHALPW